MFKHFFSSKEKQQQQQQQNNDDNHNHNGNTIEYAFYRRQEKQIHRAKSISSSIVYAFEESPKTITKLPKSKSNNKYTMPNINHEDEPQIQNLKSELSKDEDKKVKNFIKSSEYILECEGIVKIVAATAELEWIDVGQGLLCFVQKLKTKDYFFILLKMNPNLTTEKPWMFQIHPHHGSRVIETQEKFVCITEGDENNKKDILGLIFLTSTTAKVWQQSFDARQNKRNPKPKNTSFLKMDLSNKDPSSKKSSSKKEDSKLDRSAANRKSVAAETKNSPRHRKNESKKPEPVIIGDPLLNPWERQKIDYDVTVKENGVTIRDIPRVPIGFDVGWNVSVPNDEPPPPPIRERSTSVYYSPEESMPPPPPPQRRESTRLPEPPPQRRESIRLPPSPQPPPPTHPAPHVHSHRHETPQLQSATLSPKVAPKTIQSVMEILAPSPTYITKTIAVEKSTPPPLPKLPIEKHTAPNIPLPKVPLEKSMHLPKLPIEKSTPPPLPKTPLLKPSTHTEPLIKPKALVPPAAAVVSEIIPSIPKAAMQLPILPVKAIVQHRPQLPPASLKPKLINPDEIEYSESENDEEVNLQHHEVEAARPSLNLLPTTPPFTSISRTLIESVASVPPPPPPPLPSIIKSIPPPPPPPPADLLGGGIKDKVPAEIQTDARAGLMEAIRKKGGFKGAAPTENEPDKINPSSNIVKVGLAESLKTKMNEMRKFIEESDDEKSDDEDDGENW